jgi:hypothetical protein
LVVAMTLALATGSEIPVEQKIEIYWAAASGRA